MSISTQERRSPERWPRVWRGRWIWDVAPAEEAFWWRPTPASSHFTYLRCVFHVDDAPEAVAARVTCDSRYVLFVNGQQLGRGPVRAEPALLGWDEYQLEGALRAGSNVVVALCQYYGAPGPWWVPAPAMGSLGRGSFCFETEPGAAAEVISGAHWHSVPAPWIPTNWRSIHSFPPEVIDGRAAVTSLHDPGADAGAWPAAVVLSAGGHGTVLDRPPAAPYTSPSPRPIPHLTSTVKRPEHVLESGRPLQLRMHEDPRVAWAGGNGGAVSSRAVSVWDMGEIVLGHIRLTVRQPEGAAGGEVVDVVAGEGLQDDGLPQTAPRQWAGRYITGTAAHEQVTFFDPVGLRYLAVHHAADLDITVEVDVEESIYPRPAGAGFDSDDPLCNRFWQVGVRTVDVCSSDAFMDCPGREQRAWVADAYVEILVSLVTNPDSRLVRRHLALTSKSRRDDGLLAGAAACDFGHSGLPTPEYSLHWIRSLAAFWRYRGDEAVVRELRPVADALIERYEQQRGPSGLLEEFSGWVFIDWAQLERDTIIGTHDALYAAALRDYASLPGAADISGPLQTTTRAFEQLWDAERHAYVDAIGARGRGRRMSQHTNAAALLAGIVPEDRVARLIERIVDPSTEGGRLLVTAYPGSLASPDLIPNFQYEAPENFDGERDVVAAQPWFCRFLHEALFLHGRSDLVLASLKRWPDDAGNGTFQEFWGAESGRTSLCQGWSASPTFDLTSYILGVRPQTPGYGRAIVDPHLGTLRRASGRVPTPLGWLEVAVEGSSVSLRVPDGMTVDVGDQQFGGGAHVAEISA